MANRVTTDEAAPAATHDHNKRLRSALARVEAQVAAARTDDALVAAIRELEGFPVPVAYDNTRLNLIAGLCGTLCLTGAAGLYFMGFEPLYPLIALGLLVITGAAYIGIRLNRRSKLTGLSDRILRKSSLFDYGLREVPVSPQAEARKYGARFNHFRQGNHSREIRQLLKGTHDGDEHAFDYSYFHFHYVNKRRETYVTTDAKGRTRVRTRTVYDHFNRYGLIVPFAFVRGLHISESALNFFKGGWKSSSISFNKKFSVEAVDEMTAAKFLKPVLLKEIEAAGDALSGLDLEFSPSGELCFSFNDSNTLYTERKAGLETPHAFAQEITGQNRMQKLEAALEFLHTLMKYSDNNFEAPKQAHKTAERTASPWKQS